MHRRDFLKTAVASSATFFLDGCANPLMQHLFESDAFHGDGPLPMTPSDITSSKEARRIFAEYQQSGTLPVAQIFGDDKETTIAGLQSAVATWKSAVDAYRDVKMIPFSAALDIATAVAPVLRIANEMANQADARPVHSTKAPRIAGNPRASLDGTVILVPPRSLVQFTQHGYCMDSSYPAPGAGEKFRLLPMARLIPQELLPIYYGLAALATHNQKARDSMQFIVWALREAGTNGPHAAGIGPHQLAIMDAACPDGARIFLLYDKKAREQNKLGDMVKNLVKLNINGRSYNLGDFSDPERARAAVNQTLDDLTKMTIPGSIPEDDSDYSILVPGVAAHAVGASTLTPTIIIANTTTNPYPFDTSNHFAESRRRAQRIALAPPQEMRTTNGDGPGGDKPRDENSGPFKQALEDLARFFGDKELEGFPDSAMGKWALKVWAANPAVREAVRVAPVIGNLISLSEALTGKDVFTGEKIGCAGQVLAAIGTVPGAGIFTKIAGSNLPKAIKLIARSAVAERLVSSIESVSLERDAAFWLSSGTAKMAYDSMLPPGDISQRFTDIMTGGCDRGGA